MVREDIEINKGAPSIEANPSGPAHRSRQFFFLKNRRGWIAFAHRLR
jgi:hypothetical protein